MWWIIDWWGGPIEGVGPSFNLLFIREPNCVLQPWRIHRKESREILSCMSLIIGTWLRFYVIFIYVCTWVAKSTIMSSEPNYKLTGSLIQAAEILLKVCFWSTFMMPVQQDYSDNGNVVFGADLILYALCERNLPIVRCVHHQGNGKVR